MQGDVVEGADEGSCCLESCRSIQYGGKISIPAFGPSGEIAPVKGKKKDEQSK